MTPAAIAAACGFLFSPPAAYDAMPLPPSAIVVEFPLAFIRRSSPCSATRNVYGCTYEGVAYLPTWATWPGTRACWLENRRHEEAHLKGWTHP